MNDGGPAFPINFDAGEFVERGMSLRDHFAALAMLGELSTRDQDIGYEYREVAVTAYRLADAMLEAREVKHE